MVLDLAVDAWKRVLLIPGARPENLLLKCIGAQKDYYVEVSDKIKEYSSLLKDVQKCITKLKSAQKKAKKKKSKKYAKRLSRLDSKRNKLKADIKEMNIALKKLLPKFFVFYKRNNLFILSLLQTVHDKLKFLAKRVNNIEHAHAEEAKEHLHSHLDEIKKEFNHAFDLILEDAKAQSRGWLSPAKIREISFRSPWRLYLEVRRSCIEINHLLDDINQHLSRPLTPEEFTKLSSLFKDVITDIERSSDFIKVFGHRMHKKLKVVKDHNLHKIASDHYDYIEKQTIRFNLRKDVPLTAYKAKKKKQAEIMNFPADELKKTGTED